MILEIKQVTRCVCILSVVFSLTLLIISCSGRGGVRQELIDGVKITYLTPKPKSESQKSKESAPKFKVRKANKPSPSKAVKKKETKSKIKIDKVPDRYIVRQGDNLFTIADKYGLDYRDIAEENDISGEYVIFPGQELVLKSKKKTSANKRKKAKNASKKKLQEAKQTKTENELIAGKVEKVEKKRSQQSKSISQEPPRLSASGWAWPLRGKPFYVKAQGREGVYAMSIPGVKVRATNNGRVIYKGSELEDYGKLILISHDEGYLSVYGENLEILVENDQEVKKGDTIAIVGTHKGRGRIYFEMRSQGKSLNPVDIVLK